MQKEENSFILKICRIDGCETCYCLHTKSKLLKRDETEEKIVNSIFLRGGLFYELDESMEYFTGI